MDKFRIGVIGCGRISAVYKSAFSAMTDSLDVVIAVDKVKERAEAFASSFPGCIASDDIEDLLKMDLDAVHVLTPHFLHKSHVEACLEAGFNVLTEKPIATTIEDGESMIRTAERTGRQLGVIFQNRYIEGIQEARCLIEQGALGNLKGAWSHLAWHRPPSYYQCDWKGSWEKEGGGVVIDQAIHSIDLVRYLMGCPVEEIQGHIGRRILTMIEVEDEADAAIRFSNGAVYAFSACNYFVENSPIRVCVEGEKGSVLLTESTVDITLEGKAPYRVEPSQDPGDGHVRYWGNYHAVQIGDFYSKLRAGEKVPVDPRDALRTLAVVLGIYESGKNGEMPVKPRYI